MSALVLGKGRRQRQTLDRCRHDAGRDNRHDNPGGKSCDRRRGEQGKVRTEYQGGDSQSKDSAEEAARDADPHTFTDGNSSHMPPSPAHGAEDRELGGALAQVDVEHVRNRSGAQDDGEGRGQVVDCSNLVGYEPSELAANDPLMERQIEREQHGERGDSHRERRRGERGSGWRTAQIDERQPGDVPNRMRPPRGTYRGCHCVERLRTRS